MIFFERKLLRTLVSGLDSTLNLVLIAVNLVPGIKARTFIQQGKLVPDDLVTKLVFAELNGQFKKDNWLLDGYPRNLAQAELLTKLVTLTKVIDLHVPHEEIINRIKGRLIHPGSGRVYNVDYSPPKVEGKDDLTGEDLVQREDDKPEVVKARLEQFQSVTEPILDYYRERGMLIEFSGTQSKEIYPKIKKALEEVINNNNQGA